MKKQLPGGASEMKRLVVLSAVAGSLLLAADDIACCCGRCCRPRGFQSVADTWWVYHGEVEVGGRFFVNDPQKSGIEAKAEEPRQILRIQRHKAGACSGNGWLNGQTKDGLYNFDIWADNVGYNDQRYEAGVSKAGEHYFDVIWDQTPHIYSTNAQTLYSGLGGPPSFCLPGCRTRCSTMPDVRENRRCCSRVAVQAATPQRRSEPLIQRDITNNLYTTDIGIRRDTAAVAFRWTPTDAWDINFNYIEHAPLGLAGGWRRLFARYFRRCGAGAEAGQ